MGYSILFLISVLFSYIFTTNKAQVKCVLHVEKWVSVALNDFDTRNDLVSSINWWRDDLKLFVAQ